MLASGEDRQKTVSAMLRAGCSGITEKGCFIQDGVVVVVVEWKDILGTNKMNQVNVGRS